MDILLGLAVFAFALLIGLLIYLSFANLSPKREFKYNLICLGLIVYIIGSVILMGLIS